MRLANAIARIRRRAARRASSTRSLDIAPFPFRSRVAEEEAGPPKTLTAVEIDMEAEARGDAGIHPADPVEGRD